MEEIAEKSSPGTVPDAVPESPRPTPTAFTIDFGNDKKVDTQRQKTLAEKFQQRHKRGKSMSKLEDSPQTPTFGIPKKHPLSGNLPRKSSFQSEGYFSSDEKPERSKSAKANMKRSDLTLFLKNITTDRMTQSFPNAALPSIASPEGCELQNISSPEFELISPFSPNISDDFSQNIQNISNISLSSEEMDEEVFVKGEDFDFDKKSDTLSETGTYTLDVENYSEEQKAKMSIDSEFKIEQVSVQRKTEEYIKSLSAQRTFVEDPIPPVPPIGCSSPVRKLVLKNFAEEPVPLIPPHTPMLRNFNGNGMNGKSKVMSLPFKSPNTSVIKSILPPNKVLSPILSPTQNISIVGDKSLLEQFPSNGNSLLNKTFTNKEALLNQTFTNEEALLNQTFTNTMFPSPKNQPTRAKTTDEGTIISVTSSGAFRSKSEEKKKLERKLSLTKSEVHVEAYIDGKSYNEKKLNNSAINPSAQRTKNLTANIVNVQNIEVAPACTTESGGVVSGSLVFGKIGNGAPVTTGLPLTPTGKTSPSKIPSPIHTLSRPRSRNSISAPNDDLDTELILKPTQNYINSLTHKLSLDSDQDSDYEIKYGLQLNNTAHLLKQRASHIRHNSLDDRALNNKLEHFQNKNFQSIDQTYSNLLNQYRQTKVVNKINNSPSNSPIRRSSSFSNRNQINNTKSTNLSSCQKESNLECNSSNLSKSNNSIQRSSSTACIKPNYVTNRRSSTSEHKKIDRSQFGDTESSSEEDVDKNLQKRKDLGNISNTRCNRTFSLRRARLDNEPTKLKCPNTPEMRRKSFQPAEQKPERAISVDRKPVKTIEVQSRYLLNISKRGTPPPAPKEIVKTVPKPHSAPVKTPAKSATPFSRTEGGRFSMRTPKLPTPGVPVKSAKKDGNGKTPKQSGGGRSNSSLSSREVDFQNWKRRKSYDPMKAAAEGKRKEMQKRVSGMTGSYTDATGRTGAASPDSSPSHSGSVHRSQSFHGTAALEQLISSDEEDITLSADEGFSPPTPSPCELSPMRANLRHSLWERIHN